MQQTSHAQQIQFFLRRIGQELWRVEPGVLPVPFLAHSTDQAASAALAMVLQYYGRPSPDQHVMDELQSAQWGALDMPRLMVTTARACGLDATVTAGNIERLMEWLLQGVPVLVFPEDEIRGEGEPVAVVTGLTRDRSAICLHYGNKSNLWLRTTDFIALCGSEAFTAVPVMERHQSSHARTRNRTSLTAKPWLDLMPDPVSAMAA